MKLFDIGQEYQGLYELAEIVETDENGVIIDNTEALKDLFDGVEAELKDKAENVAYVCKDLNASAKALSAEADRLAKKARSLLNNEAALKIRLKEALSESGQTKIKTDKFSFSVSKRDSFNYDDISMAFLDDKFIKIKQEIDKNAIKSFYKNGGVIDGLKVSESDVLSIR